MISSLIVPLRTEAIKDLVEDQFGCALDLLHEWGGAYALLTRETDQSTAWHAAFYELTTTPAWHHAYAELLERVMDFYPEPIIVQRVPTFRVALPDNIAVGEPHRDRDYQHSPAEVNWWVPLTPAHETSAVWCETEPDRGDYLPLECGPNEALIFDAANLRHFNKPNETGDTRVSFDFRVMLESHYDESGPERRSLNTNLPMRLPRFPGELTYWERAECLLTASPTS